MARYDGRLARLERMVNAGPALQESYVTFSFTESLTAAIKAAEKESGVPLLDINPWTLSATAWTGLAQEILEAEIEVVHQCFSTH